MLYRSYLSAELKKQGYEIIPGKKGTFEIANVPTELIKEFSRRRDQIVTALDGRESGGALAEKLALMTRDAKPHYVDQAALRQEWRERASALGYSVEKIQQMTLQAENKMDKGLPAIDHLKETIKSLENQKSVWTKEEMIFPVLRSGIADGITYEKVQKQIEEAIDRKELVQLREGRYSSPGAIEQEMRILKLGQDLKNQIEPVDSFKVNALIEKSGSHLNESQKLAVQTMLQSGNNISGVDSRAGTGKTTMLAVVHQIQKFQGKEVLGLAFTGKASELMQNETGIPSQTLHSFLIQKQNGVGLPDRRSQTWIVDEASTVGNRQMEQLLNYAQKEHAKILLIGDRYQLQSVESGKAFEMLQEKGVLVTAKMDQILRQKNPILKDIVNTIVVQKDTDKALRIMDKHGMVKQIEDRLDRLTVIARDYLSLSQKEMAHTLIVCSKNFERKSLNELIREGLKDKGVINANTERTYNVAVPKSISEIDHNKPEHYSPGDMIRFSSAHKTLEVAKGDRGIIQGIDGLKIRIQMQDSNKIISLDLSKHSKFETYTSEKRSFGVGDQVMFLKNDQKGDLKVVNGSKGIILETNERLLKVQTRSGIKEVDLRTYNYLDHSYGSTLYKAQGLTSEKVMIHIDTSERTGNSANGFYVGVSRATHEATVYTDSKINLPDAVRSWETRELAIDHLREKNIHFENGKEVVSRQSEKSFERSLSF